jgi:hypothetical protein
MRSREPFPCIPPNPYRHSQARDEDVSTCRNGLRQHFIRDALAEVGRDRLLVPVRNAGIIQLLHDACSLVMTWLFAHAAHHLELSAFSQPACGRGHVRGSRRERRGIP